MEGVNWEEVSEWMGMTGRLILRDCLSSHPPSALSSASAVRRRCLGVLSHLILNDMMKIKGHIARIAMCMRDGEDPEVARMAKAFFSTLVGVVVKFFIYYIVVGIR